MPTRQLSLLLTPARAVLLGATLTIAGCSGCSDPMSATGTADSGETEAASSTGTATIPGDAAAFPASPAAAVAAAVGPASTEYTAEVSEIAEAGGQGEYAAVATFTSAAGREFEMTVEDGKSGQLLANSTVGDIRGSVYSHTLPFKHGGNLSTVVVRIVEKESGREVDRWSPE